MQLMVTIELGNSAFAVEGPGGVRDGTEIAKVLQGVSDLLTCDGTVEEGWGMALRDSNGNRVGTAQIFP